MNKKTPTFFASANGFDGFVSYFGKIFDPYEYERIFILKGGPGTGKSTFLKTVVKAFENKDDASISVILCSSDPKSLDGVIIESKGRKIALLDGTAPHTTDPILPGAVEKMINLGEFWNETLLKNNTEIINNLSISKNNHYKNAYDYLSVAKRCDNIVFECVKACFNIKETEILNGIFSGENAPKSNIKTMILNAFCKQGFFELTPSYYDFNKAIQIVGVYGSEYLFMDKILEFGERYSENIIISPSPLDQSKIDSVYFEKEKTYVYVGKKVFKENTVTVDTSRYVDVKKLDLNRNKIETLYKEREAMLWCATDEFNNAAIAHEALEKIYTAAMNFKKCDKVINKVCEEIEERLFNEDLNVQIP